MTAIDKDLRYDTNQVSQANLDRKSPDAIVDAERTDHNRLCETVRIDSDRLFLCFDHLAVIVTTSFSTSLVSVNR